jgi:hypothetical protein
VRLSQDVVDLLRNPESPDGLVRDALLDMGWDVAKVYVVCGFTGEYSDQSSWTVAAFLTEGQAVAFCDRLNDWCKTHGLHRDAYRIDYEAREEAREAGNPDDPHFRCDYTGTGCAAFWRLKTLRRKAKRNPKT